MVWKNNIGKGAIKDFFKRRENQRRGGGIESFVEKGDLANGLKEARNLTDTKFIDNLKSKEKTSRRPHGRSFEAIAILKKRYESQDKYLIYEMDDGSKTNELFVF